MWFIIILIIMAIISVVLAVRSYIKQLKIEELKHAKKELKRWKVVYHKDSSSSER